MLYAGAGYITLPFAQEHVQCELEALLHEDRFKCIFVSKGFLVDAPPHAPEEKVRTEHFKLHARRLSGGQRALHALLEDRST
jgi:hypothetical protein